jgi:chorismate dehydratase
MSLRCGRIVYTNDLPIYTAFDEGVLAYPGTLHADVPAKLNAMLVDGRLDLSPVSAFAWAQQPDELVLLPDLCIGGRDEVVSVVLVSPTPPALLDGVPIALTPESASGRNLLRVLLERRYGVQPRYEDSERPLVAAEQGRSVLLIGDSAIDALERFPSGDVYDLGTLWHEWTGHQTVFAVWAARRDAFERDPQAIRECMHALTDSYTWSRSHMDAVISAAHRTKPRRAGFYESYYGKLNFTFHSAAQSGLRAFCRELHEIGAIPAVPQCIPEAIGVVTR